MIYMEVDLIIPDMKTGKTKTTGKLYLDPHKTYELFEFEGVDHLMIYIGSSPFSIDETLDSFIKKQQSFMN